MRASFVLLCLLGLVLPVIGQSNYAVVTGTVTDSQSLPVARATVQFKALSTGAIRVLATNDQGLFFAPALPPDDYELTTESTGLPRYSRPCILKSGRNWRSKSDSRSAR